MIKTIINKILFILIVAFLPLNIVLANCDDHDCNLCCANKGGIKYSDSSAGRYVCNNGDYSVCYSTIHAVMDLQKFEGCCMWKGGVLKTNSAGLIVCRDGSYSEICSLKNISE